MINIISPINQLGYGIAGMNIAKSLNDITEVSLWPIGHPEVASQADADIVSDMIRRSRLPDFNAPCVRIWHQHDMSQFVGNGMKIGFPIFELDEFSELEKHHLSVLDKILVCSSWAKQVVLDQIDIQDKDVHVIPLGVDGDLFKPENKAGEESTTVFFNCGKWEVRKGHDILVQAFNEAFSKDDDVELWMMCENPFFSEQEQLEWVNLYQSSELGSKIKFIGRVQGPEQVYNVMKETDCGVFPSRAEGWNLELLEMMSCGKQVIATNYAGHTEFCNKDNCFLIPPRKTELAYDGRWFHGKCGSWIQLGQPEVSNISSMMKKVHQNKAINQAGISTAKKYSWSNTASLIMDAINV